MYSWAIALSLSALILSSSALIMILSVLITSPSWLVYLTYTWTLFLWPWLVAMVNHAIFSAFAKYPLSERLSYYILPSQFFLWCLSSNDVQATILVRSSWFLYSWCAPVVGQWQNFFKKIESAVFFVAIETNRAMMRDGDFSIFWSSISRLLVEISLWNLCRAIIGLYSTQ